MGSSLQDFDRHSWFESHDSLELGSHILLSLLRTTELPPLEVRHVQDFVAHSRQKAVFQLRVCRVPVPRKHGRGERSSEILLGAVRIEVARTIHFDSDRTVLPSGHVAILVSQRT